MGVDPLYRNLSTYYGARMNKAYRIVIADDHHMIVDGIKAMLVDEPDLSVVGTASNGREALLKVKEMEPDLLILDLDMPVMSGMEVVRQLVKESVDLHIVIMSMHAESSVVEHLKQLGIMGYIVKSADKEEFLFGLRRVLGGKRYFHPDAYQQSQNTAREIRSDSSQLEKLNQLSQREKEVLAEIAKGKTSAEIAETLFLSPRTIETHRKNIHQKLDIKTLAGIIRFAIECGMVA
jgi:two-component system nitrate/nitrite response regulator NarL